MKKILKKIIPGYLQKNIRKGLQSVVFYYCISKFIKNPISSDNLSDEFLNKLIYGWGNRGFSASKEYLRACLNHTMNTDGPVLECGSGLSTILAGAIAEKKGLSYIVLEHEKEWAEKTLRYLKKYKLDSVTVLLSPLERYEDFDWYDISSLTIPDKISLVICDGPPGTTKGGRVGLVQVMRNKFSKNCVILLDDVMRKDEYRIARKWKNELNADLEIIGNESSFAKLILSGTD